MGLSALVNMILDAYRAEREADFFYTVLLEETGDFKAVDSLAEARRDERLHARMIYDLIVALTGSHPVDPVPQIPRYQNLGEGIRMALADEREAAEFYGKIINIAESKQIKDTFIFIREDKIVHALKFEALLEELTEKEDRAVPPAAAGTGPATEL